MQSNITKSHRVNWIDELKGFILILVCLSHVRIHIPLGTGGGIYYQFAPLFVCLLSFFYQDYCLVHADIPPLVPI